MLITRIILGIVFLLAGWLIVLGNYWVHNSALTKDIVEKAYFESLEMDVNSGNNLESMYRTMYSFAAMRTIVICCFHDATRTIVICCFHNIVSSLFKFQFQFGVFTKRVKYLLPWLLCS